MHLDSASFLTLLGIVTAAFLSYIPIRRSIKSDRVAAQRQAKEDLAAEIAAAVKAATDPLAWQLAERTQQRDYLQQRVDDLQDQINGRRGPR